MNELKLNLFLIFYRTQEGGLYRALSDIDMFLFQLIFYALLAMLWDVIVENNSER